ncbi:AMP-binding protein, partial [Deinococcus multiflagellatus]|uniref:AMP-binding protein n=1 Tax=Deinococcus multiflagellatus TaxID=1656887 RepID=UPI001CCC92ED
MNWAKEAYAIEDGEGSILHSSMSFDLTVTSLYLPLIAGKRVLVLPEMTAAAFADLLDMGRQFSLLKITPAHLAIVNTLGRAHDLASAFKTLVVGGESLPMDSVRNICSLTRVFNEYGPTETVVGCCVYQVSEPQDSGSVP